MSQSLRYHGVKLGGSMEVASGPRPTIEEGNEVEVQLKAVALQPIDHKMIEYGFMVKSWPCIPGMNGSGVVTTVGKDVKAFAVGDEVISLHVPGDDRQAAFQEYAVLKENIVAKKPESLTFEEAASLPIAYVTALAAVYKALDIPIPFLPAPVTPCEPRSILVLGGSSSVGAAAIQLLRLAQPKSLILTTCSTKHHARMSDLGANHAFDRDASLDEIRSVTEAHAGVDCVLGAVEGAVDRPEILQLLSQDGSKKFAEVVSGRDTKDVPEGVKLIPANGYMVWGQPGVMEGLTGMLEDGTFRLPVEARIVGKGFEVIGTAMEELKKGTSGVKLVVTL